MCCSLADRCDGSWLCFSVRGRTGRGKHSAFIRDRVVAPGETLWSVAAAYASGDVQGMVNQIREANNLKGVDLQAGQRLRVPVK